MVSQDNLLAMPFLCIPISIFVRKQSCPRNLLQRVRTEGDWESWLHFFLTGVYETATQAVQTSRSILELFQNDQMRIETLGRSLGTTLRIYKLLQSMPLITIPRASQETTISVPTVTATLARLQELGIVREITGRQRDKLYSYEKYIQLLNEGTEPIKR